MKTYTVFQQETPKNDSIVLIHVGSVEAADGTEAIAYAHQMPVFKAARTRRDALAAFPIVEAA